MTFRLPAAALTLLLAGCVSDATTPAPPATPAAAARTFPELTQGMTADEVRAKLGSPESVSPMESPEGRAEVWVYRFENTVGTEQVATGMKSVPVFAGMPDAAGGGSFVKHVQEPVYGTAEKKEIVTLHLLLFNGRLAAQKTGIARRLDY